MLLEDDRGGQPLRLLVDRLIDEVGGQLGIDVEARHDQEQQAASEEVPAFPLEARFAQQTLDGSVRHGRSRPLLHHFGPFGVKGNRRGQGSGRVRGSGPTKMKKHFVFPAFTDS